VVFPQAPNPVPFDANGNYQNSLWNVGFLDYDTAISNLPGSRTMVGFGRTAAALEFQHTHLKSNEVIIKANLRKPPPGIVPCKVHCLPNTGSPNHLLEFGLLGGLVLMTGTALVARNRRRTA
jgi:LPXTG-motif cell wall-anchored protein